jgi:hypothetical protein
MSTLPLFLEMVGRSQVFFTSSPDLLVQYTGATVNRCPETSPSNNFDSIRSKGQPAMSDTGISWARAGVLLWSAFFLATGTGRLAADHNKLLNREFRRAISRHVARDSQGYCYLLVPSPGSEGRQGVTLKVSRKPHPESIADFSATVPLPAL